MGERGMVTDALSAMISRTGAGVVYACGPNPMLRAVAEVCLGARVPCQVAVEEMMACGLGVCWTCAVPLIAVDGRGWWNVRACVEGPVFNDYAFGGYLIFAGIKPFIDGRYFYGDAFIKRYFDAAFVLSDELPRLLAEYHIAWTLLGAKTPAVVLLDHLPGWRRLYADDIAAVHVRTDGASLCPVSVPMGFARS